MATDPRIDAYDWRGGREATLRWGPTGGPTVLLAVPLFEEANRFRSVAAATMRALAAQGIAGAIADLPGTGDSALATRDARLSDWREAFATAAGELSGPVHVLAVRGGALVDGEADVASRWYLSPVEGASLVRELRRARALSEGENKLFAGNDLSDDLLSALEAAEPTIAEPLRVVRLASDPRPADAKLNFAPRWRAAEPGRDDLFARAVADDVASWIATCGG